MALQLYIKQEMTQETPLCPHPAAEVCASSSTVIQKLFDHPMYISDFVFL